MFFAHEEGHATIELLLGLGVFCPSEVEVTRQQLWDRMKKAGITHSKRLDCPPDGDLKVVFACCQVSAKGMVDFLCGLDGKVDGKRE